MITLSKVRRQNFRDSYLPPATTAPAMSGLDHLARIQSQEDAQHDKWVADLSLETLRQIWLDLQNRPAYDRRNPEHRWTMGRRAAVGRRLFA